MTDKFAAGIKIAGELMGDDVVKTIQASLGSTRFGAGLGALAVDHVFNGVWARPGLDRRARSLVTMGILIALRQIEEFKVHVLVATRNGCTVQEIEEAIYHATAYAGFPAGVQATAAATEVLRKEGLVE
jgi:4-carboxymuconolactone decarboxylase